MQRASPGAPTGCNTLDCCLSAAVTFDDAAFLNITHSFGENTCKYNDKLGIDLIEAFETGKQLSQVSLFGIEYDDNLGEQLLDSMPEKRPWNKKGFVGNQFAAMGDAQKDALPEHAKPVKGSQSLEPQDMDIVRPTPKQQATPMPTMNSATQRHMTCALVGMCMWAIL